jgi:hypothetical protein
MQEQTQQNQAQRANKENYYSIKINLQQMDNNETPKVTSFEVIEENKKDRAERILEYLDEMLELKEAEMQATTSPLADDPDEAKKQRAIYYYFKSIVKMSKKIA